MAPNLLPSCRAPPGNPALRPTEGRSVRFQKLTAELWTPERFLLAVLPLTFLAQLGVMVLLPVVLPPGVEPVVQAFLAASFLTILTAPVLWHAVLGPLRILTLREQERNQVLSTAVDAILTVDTDGCIQSLNPAAARMFGCAAAEAVGEAVDRFLTWPSWGDGLQAPLPPGETRIVCTGRGGVAQRPGGLTVPIELTISEAWIGDRRLFTAVARDMSERRALEAKLAHQAFHDPLTGLPNRALFRDRLETALARAARHNKAVALVFLDLDNFKTVNDSLGHERGDLLLQEVASRLSRCARTVDTVARLGGDEFTLILEDLKDLEQAEVAVARIMAALREPIHLEGKEVVTTASIGVAGTADCRMDPERLLRQADLAMYEAKSRGKGGYAVFDDRMGARAQQRLELELDLRRALEREELHLAYQPIVDLERGRVLQVEALLRWEHPTRGGVSPAEFIPIAEETGLILPLGEWVLREACAQLGRWHREFPTEPPLRMNVNLSTRQLQSGLVEAITRVLSEAGLAPGSLTLEITESAVMHNTEVTLQLLGQLRELGVGLAIDDFGTGYSSMAYLSNFPVNALKIDRSFIRNLHQADDQEIVRAMVSLGKSLRLAVTAEGIETAEQLAHLRAVGCDSGQGFLLARPGDASQTALFLAQPQSAITAAMAEQSTGVTGSRSQEAVPAVGLPV